MQKKEIERFWTFSTRNNNVSFILTPNLTKEFVEFALFCLRKAEENNSIAPSLDTILEVFIFKKTESYHAV